MVKAVLHAFGVRLQFHNVNVYGCLVNADYHGCVLLHIFLHFSHKKLKCAIETETVTTFQYLNMCIPLMFLCHNKSLSVLSSNHFFVFMHKYEPSYCYFIICINLLLVLSSCFSAINERQRAILEEFAKEEIKEGNSSISEGNW